MALESNIKVGDVFDGEDNELEYEIFVKDFGPTSSTPMMQNVAGFAFTWTLRKAPRRIDPFRQRSTAVLTKTSDEGAVFVDGAFADDRESNQQRVRVRIAAADIEDLDPVLYVMELIRSDAGARKVLSYGTWPMLVSTP